MALARRSSTRRIALLAAFALISPFARAATFTVTTTADSGAGSLRQAILDANGSPGADTIAFAIPGAGVQTIAVGSELTITDTVVIDGYTQPGSAANTDPQASNAVILIDLQGAGTDGFVVTGGAAEIHGLALHGFQNALNSAATGSSFVAGCFVGVLPSGLSAPGNAVGIWSHGTGPATVGDGNPANRNVISGNGVGLQLEDTLQSVVRGNLIGANPAGTAAMANGTGVQSTTVLLLGGDAAGQGNVISGNSGDGVHLTGGPHVITGNLIGLDVTGFERIGNGGVGVYANASGPIIRSNYVSANGSHGIDIASSNDAKLSANLIGLNLFGLGELGNRGAAVHSSNAGQAFVIIDGENWMSNNAAGIWMESEAFNANLTIGANRIYRNEGLGIVIGAPPPAIHPNGTAINFPLITSVVPGSTTTTISGYWNASNIASASVNFYSSPPCSKKRPWHFDEGQTYLGSAGTGGGGQLFFSFEAPIVVTNEVITAAISYQQCMPQCFIPGGEGGFEIFNLSTPFSQRLPFSISPSSGDPAGGQAVTILGTDFAAGATVTIGGQPVGNPNIVSPTEIDATAPALPAGTVNDLTVVNLDGSHGTLPMAYLADFLDVPTAHMFHDYVALLLTNGIATGVGGGNFGVDASTLRQQMAVFLLKSKHGICYTPPPCTGIFADVPCPSLFADWIEALAAEGITGGCGGGNYCPGDAVRRDQMAAFLLKAEHGSAYVPPPCAGVFGDVACPSLFADWIEQLAAENVTVGCGGGNYCPSSPNTRGQMAVFLTKTFGLE
jgi:hypothetical protein